MPYFHWTMPLRKGLCPRERFDPETKKRDAVEGSEGGIREEYKRYTFMKIVFMIAMVIALFLIAGYEITIGARDLSISDVYGILYDHITGKTHAFGTMEWIDDYTVWNHRLPRVAMGVIAGAGLAIGGAAMQSIVKNPLADPYTTGISSGAVFGVSVALVLGFSVGSSLGQYGIVLNAFIFGLIPVGIIVLVSRFGNMSPATLILSGVAISYLFRALSTFLLVSSDTDTIAHAYIWQIGTLKDAVWGDIPLMFAVTLIGVVFLILSSRKLNVLTLGDESAKSLGLDAEGFRIICLVIISVMTAAIVSFAGIIGFVGLVVPHIARMFLGGDNKYVIPASVIIGPVLLLAADTLARILIQPNELPVGIVMSFIGGPLFLLLILRQKKDVW